MPPSLIRPSRRSLPPRRRRAAPSPRSPRARSPARSRTRPRATREFFVFIHASGGWDVTLWADPRNEKRGIVDPATTDNTDTAPLHRWVDAPHDGDVKSFAPVRPAGSNIAFGPGIGELADMYDRLTVVNGLSMNTVSHPDGTAFSATGRHLTGSRVPGVERRHHPRQRARQGRALPRGERAVPLHATRASPASTAARCPWWSGRSAPSAARSRAPGSTTPTPTATP